MSIEALCFLDATWQGQIQAACYRMSPILRFWARLGILQSSPGTTKKLGLGTRILRGGSHGISTVVAPRAAKRRLMTLCDEQKRTQTESPSSVKRVKSDISEGFKQEMKPERQLESGQIWRMDEDGDR